MKQYCITILKDDLRIMKYPHNSYGTYKTEQKAQNALSAIIANNNDSDINAVLGNILDVKIMPVDCYPGGDPKQTIFNTTQ